MGDPERMKSLLRKAKLVDESARRRRVLPPAGANSGNSRSFPTDRRRW